MGGACTMCGGKERCVQGLGEETEGKRMLGRSTLTWEGNIKTDLQEVCGGNGLD